MKGGVIYEDGSRTKEAAVSRTGYVVTQTPDLGGLQEFSAISVKILMQKN